MEVCGISRNRLLTENGDTDIDADLSLADDLGMPGVNIPLAFRIMGVRATEIVAIHDLSDWPIEEVDDSMWQPNAEKVAAVRFSTHGWKKRF
jgi:hypothetical protein